MTRPELLAWLGYPANAEPPMVDQAMIELMADVKVPHTDDEHIETFRVFLQARSIPAGEIIKTGRFSGNSGTGYKCVIYPDS